ncbi:MAG: transposase [Candidatus Thiodiazotropha sp. (ex Epidulcina cf. delphinae)]|nr:transposase [Candidatus Thiodiazotropha sp. (ex Epidulcina cf. delphinae)]
MRIDESGFTKKGRCSVGVARQYNGRLGKTDNYQVGVFAALNRGDRVKCAFSMGKDGRPVRKYALLVTSIGG